MRINVGSAVTQIHLANSAVDTATKGAVDAITGVLAHELGPRKIRVNSINPGMVETEGAHSAGFIGSDFANDAIAQTPPGRIGQPDEIADVAVFLASNDSRWITGEKLVGSGGVRLAARRREVDAASYASPRAVTPAGYTRRRSTRARWQPSV